MTKAASARSSAQASPLPSTSRQNEDGDETRASDEQRSSEVAPDDCRRASLTDDSHILVDVDTTHSRPPESQPMTTSSSASSNAPSKDAPANMASSTSAPYGTRSRNRNGAPRPNYAEDKELDNEIEVSTPSRDNIGRKGARTADATTTSSVDSGRPSAHSRKGLSADTDQAIPTQAHYKEPIPGTSTFSANPAGATPHTSTSKKRKATSQPSLVVLPPHAQSHASSSATQTITRRASMAMQASSSFRESNMMTFENCGGVMKDDCLVADDGTVLKVNDHVYLVCEPPGEPYYLGRIMEFLHINNDANQPIDALRLNWYYRPKDIGRKVNDTRQVFASMHSDISPLTALRGKCQILHKSEVEKLDDLRKTRDSFWYEKLYDRYIHRFYDVIPTAQVINVPDDVKRVLDQRWKYIVVEPGRGKELTSAVKTCKRCSRYCASNDSVDCAVCDNTYHMSCVNPPLLKKPSRGFAWACGPCSKAQARKIEARNTPNITDSAADGDDDDLNDEEDDFPITTDGADTGRTSPAKSVEGADSIHPGTAEQIHQASLWLFRYLGIHCKVEDALDYDDRIYPRASSRLGPRHQANVPMWPGRPVEYVKAADVKRRYIKGGAHKKDTKLSKEALAALEADKLAREKRPKWVMDEPPGYIHRGEDYSNDDPNNTAQLLFKIPGVDESSEVSGRGSENGGSEHLDLESREQIIDDYMARAKQLAKPLGLPEFSTNLLDVAINMLQIHHFDTEKALEALRTVDKAAFKEPELSPAEVKKFEDGVTKFGSEWHSIKKHVKTVSAADIVRFYYTWKKTERGKQIWGNYSGRKGKKEVKRAEATTGKLQDDVADDFDDSAFDNEKASEKKRGFQCKFCGTRSSRQWRRAPNTPAGTTIPENPNGKTSGKEKGPHLMVALCRRCAELWRRYAIQWEDIEEVAKKVAQTGGRAYKRKIDEELLKELVTANEVMNETSNATSNLSMSAGGTPAPSSVVASGPEPGRKKLKGVPEKETSDSLPETTNVGAGGQSKKKTGTEKLAASAPIPEPPKPKPMPCVICHQMDPMGDQHLTCKECRMSVHRNCYGVVTEVRSPSKWVCDMCSNDKNPQVSIQYKCMLCPVEHTVLDFPEASKVTGKKKSEKERERDRIEKEQAQKAAEFFRKKQEELNKPVEPREPLKRTANNNWVHVTCAVFTPEVKFGNAKALEPSEGIPSIPSARYDEVCKACKQKGGACVACHACRAPVHVECAHQNGFVLGFDIAPVKGSRRDQFNIVNINGEVGTMTAAIWCKEHVPTKTIVHRMHDIVDDAGLNALQLYVRTFKQADLTLTGTVRKANLINQSAKLFNPTSNTTPSNRRTSTTTVTNGHSSSTGRGSITHVKSEDYSEESGQTLSTDARKVCVTCNVDVSPKWWPFPAGPHNLSSSLPVDPSLANHNSDGPFISDKPPTNGHAGPPGEGGTGHIAIAAAALDEPAWKPSLITKYQCHQCHWKKGRKEQSPAAVTPSLRELSRPPTSTGPSVNGSGPDTDMAQVVPTYSWAPPPSYPVTGPFNWPRQPAPTQNGTVINPLNNAPTPRPPSVPPLRQSSQALARSPHQNGHAPPLPNGYPPSPRHIMGSPPVHIPNGGYAPYSSARPSSQPLTNGVPQPRGGELAFGPLNGPVHSRSSYGPPHGSPPILRESLPQQQRDPAPQNSTVRPTDGRVNGGASASPSLRNLLS